MERLDPKPARAEKRSSLVVGVVAAVVAGVAAFLLLFLLGQVQPGTSGLIGAGISITVGGIVSAITLPTPERER